MVRAQRDQPWLFITANFFCNRGRQWHGSRHGEQAVVHLRAWQDEIEIDDGRINICSKLPSSGRGSANVAKSWRTESATRKPSPVSRSSFQPTSLSPGGYRIVGPRQSTVETDSGAPFARSKFGARGRARTSDRSTRQSRGDNDRCTDERARPTASGRRRWRNAERRRGGPRVAERRRDRPRTAARRRANRLIAATHVLEETFLRSPTQCDVKSRNGTIVGEIRGISLDARDRYDERVHSCLLSADKRS